nr:short-chain dehydrogenase/reductase StrK [Stachybotrys sp.]
MDTAEFFRAQRENLPVLLRKEHVEGKTFIITGSNHGIGREAARHVVRIGAARVILAVRSISKGEEAKAWIESTTGVKGVAQVWHLDTTDFQAVRAFASRALSELDRIDGFVQNAAVTVGDHELNKEGYELSIAGNVISTLVLAFHLLPRMSETAKKYGGTPHLVFLTTGLAFTQPDAMELVDHEGGAFAALNRKGESSFKPSPKRYSVSNIFKVLLIREFTKLFPYSETGVVMNMLNPGYCNTGLARNGPLGFRLVFNLGGLLIGRSPEMGSRTILHAMQAGIESDGHFLSDCKIKDYIVTEWVTNEKGQAIQKRVWDDFLERVEKFEPGLFERVSGILPADKRP